MPKYDDWGINHVVQCLTYTPPGKLPAGLNNDVSCFESEFLNGRVRKFLLSQVGKIAHFERNDAMLPTCGKQLTVKNLRALASHKWVA